MMQHATRSELLLFRSRSRSYGRRLISAEAIEELTRRAAKRYLFGDCGERRADRVEKLVYKRRAQVIQLLTDAVPIESSSQYIAVIDSLGHLHAEMQAIAASEAIGDMLKLVKSKKEETHAS